MIREKRRHEVPQLNTTSTADISFMLLTFFLMTTSMDSDKGLPRQLPPMPDEKQEQAQEVKKKDVMNVYLHEDNSLTVDEQPVKIAALKAKVETFVAHSKDHIISIQADRKANYETYFAMQNEIMLAYSDLRNSYSKKKYGKRFSELTPEQSEVVKAQYPQRISEAEPQVNTQAEPQGNTDVEANKQ